MKRTNFEVLGKQQHTHDENSEKEEESEKITEQTEQVRKLLWRVGWKFLFSYVHAMILELCGICCVTIRQGILDSIVESCYLYELNAGGDFAAGAAWRWRDY